MSQAVSELLSRKKGDGLLNYTLIKKRRTPALAYSAPSFEVGNRNQVVILFGVRTYVNRHHADSVEVAL